jgi:hypothetical protein
MAGKHILSEKEEADRLYMMMRAQIAPFHDKKFLHTTTKSVCGEAIDLASRNGDSSYWYSVKIELGKIPDPEGREIG